MAEPGREAVAGIVLHRPHLGRRPERVRDALGGALVIGREADADMTIIQDRVIPALGRRHPLYVVFDLAESCVFVKQSPNAFHCGPLGL